MKNKRKLSSRLLLAVLALVLFFGAQALLPEDSAAVSAYPEPAQEAVRTDAALPAAQADAPDEHGSYDTPDEVARYLQCYGRLPDNYITKAQARQAGWQGGALERYCPGKCIGGDRFGNYEKLLPEAEGRVWTECDLNTLGASSRGAERLVFSNDGLIYYTDDHYDSFTLLSGTP